MISCKIFFVYLPRYVPVYLQIPNEVYRPPVEVYRSCCRQIKKGYQRNNSPRYYISIPEGDEDGKQSEIEEPRVVVQMDTESPAIYQKSCLDHYFDKPIQVSNKWPSDIIFIFTSFCIYSDHTLNHCTGNWRRTRHILWENDWRPSFLLLF